MAVAKGATASGSTLTIIIKGALNIMAWTKAKTAIVTTAVVLLIAGTVTVGIERHIESRQFTVARSPWSDAGAATPKAALETLAWALTTDHTDRAQNLMRWEETGLDHSTDPSLEHQINLVSVIGPAVKDIVSFKILSILPDQDPDEVSVKFQKTFKDRRIVPFPVTAKSASRRR